MSFAADRRFDCLFSQLIQDKTAATGESPTMQVQKIATSFSTITTYLGKAKVTLTSEQEEQISSKITDIIIVCSLLLSIHIN